MNIDLLLVVVPDTIRDQDRISITMFVILGDNVVLIVLILLGRELLGAEHLQDTGFPVVEEAELLVGLLHGLLQVACAQGRIALESNVVDLGLLVLVDIDVDNHLALVSGIILLLDLDIHILEAFAIKELLDHLLGTIHDVRRYLEPLLQAQFSLQILTLALLDTAIMHLRDTWTLFQLDVQPDLIALDL